ncbi:hypothetical protein P691DRAFT_54656 [Macrolepiota fuliginosa MF-IS2]|uniref:Uncharacterized protein n=1 Tax=Macrolepiota fuliginosa MF-IS2 TaxID=1400762 RepID=A0A9P5XC46_9AGAR|nr:hypothetical protein P691DRAFT_54656 [Macrolepiota fuliginosa MF-IS2]
MRASELACPTMSACRNVRESIPSFNVLVWISNQVEPDEFMVVTLRQNRIKYWTRNSENLKIEERHRSAVPDEEWLAITK